MPPNHARFDRKHQGNLSAILEGTSNSLWWYTWSGLRGNYWLKSTVVSTYTPDFFGTYHLCSRLQQLLGNSLGQTGHQIPSRVSRLPPIHPWCLRQFASTTPSPANQGWNNCHTYLPGTTQSSFKQNKLQWSWTIIIWFIWDSSVV